MKKIQLLTGALLLASSVFAQKAELTKKDFVQEKRKTAKILPSAKAEAIWSNDFSDASTWVLTNTGAEDAGWSIETDENAMPNAGAELFPFASNSLANGYALVNSDGATGNADGNGAIVSQITTANSIDLSDHPSVILKFNHNYRWWHEDRGVRVSNDNGTTWTDFPLTSDNGGVITDGYPDAQNTANPEIEVINISTVAGGQSEVIVQFYYNDNDFWGWYWSIDDVEILELPDNDIVLFSAWASTSNLSEYGRTPLSQVSDSLYLGGDVYNFGAATQSNIELEISISNNSGETIASSNLTESSLMNDSILIIEEAVSVSLAEGVYTLSAQVSSDGDQESGELFSDNSYSRVFEITDYIYSLDGIGVYDEPTVTSFGSTSTSEGNILFTRYKILEETTIYSLQIGISSNSTVGCQIFPFLLEESVFLDAEGLLNQAANVLSNRIAENNDGVIITQSDIDNNIVNAKLEETVLAPGTYYAAAELFTAGGTDDAIYILDDETVWQTPTASLYYSANATTPEVYTNGTAIAIRLGLTDGIGLEEASNALFSVSPNPSNGVFTVIASEEDNYTLEVINVLGEIVSSKLIDGSINETINISNLNAGIYLVKVSTATSQNVQRVVIK